MAVDTPAKIAILGAGPIGLEAALYARFLGYDVEVLEMAEFAAPFVKAGGSQITQFTFGELHSSLGRAALQAQGNLNRLPDFNRHLSFSEWYETYWRPLAESDLLAESIYYAERVMHVGKVEIHKSDMPAEEYDRGAWDFRLLTCKQNGEQRLLTADVLFDCSGVLGYPLPLGHGGIPALGEQSSTNSSVCYNPFPLEQVSTESLANQQLLVVGEDAFAPRTLLQLAQLKRKYPATNIFWSTRYSQADTQQSGWIMNKQWSSEQVEQIQKLISQEQITWWPEHWVESLHQQNQDIIVTFSGGSDISHKFQHVFCHNGHAPEYSYLKALPIEICSRTDKPLSNGKHAATEIELCVTSEPNCYILGAKSFGRCAGFNYKLGLKQIQHIFTILGDRANLNLYAQYAS